MSVLRSATTGMTISLADKGRLQMKRKFNELQIISIVFGVAMTMVWLSGVIVLLLFCH